MMGHLSCRPCLFSSSRFSRITTVLLTNNPESPITSTSLSCAAPIIAPIGCLMPIFTVEKPLFVKIISTRFLPISCTSPLTVAKSIFPRPTSDSSFSICGSRYATAFFITSADCRTNGNCISPLPKSSPTVFIPESKKVLIISSGLIPSAIASSRSDSSPFASPSIILWGRRSCIGKRANSSATESRRAMASAFSNSSRNFCSGS